LTSKKQLFNHVLHLFNQISKEEYFKEILRVKNNQGTKEMVHEKVE
jgi:hypothetical protein